jgi:alpha-L-fucosidase
VDRVKGEVKVLNFAVGGRSSRSWHDERRLPPALAEKPDSVLIQFGHNDQPGKGPERETDPATGYRDYLRLYVNDFRKVGAKPIILSSVVRRIFDENGKIKSTLGPWAEAAKAVATERNVPFIELHAASLELQNRLGPAASMTFNLLEGDTSHFNRKGAEAIADLIVARLKDVAPELADRLKPETHEPAPQQPSPAMRQGSQATVIEREGVMTRQSDAVQWFTEARFGMFVHWGLYSIPAGVWRGEVVRGNWYSEWIRMKANAPHGIPADEYHALAREFNPVHFDADAWIREARNAGMRYFLITSKHHDGFALWPSRVSAFNVTDVTPFGRDILGELRAACDAHGVNLGFYYSHWQDWEHPGGARPRGPDESIAFKQPDSAAFERYWQEKCLPQVRELMESYSPAFFWFDNWRQDELLTPDRLERLIRLVREIDGRCLINSRIGTTWNYPGGDALVDYRSMGDNSFPKERIREPWETSATMQRSWGYHRMDYGWKPTGQLLRHLVDNASRGGNYQLNIGPMADGRLPSADIRRLRAIGAWMAVNGEAIYGTMAGSPAEPEWGRVTERRAGDGKRTLYLHVYDWKPGQTLEVGPVRGRAVRCEALETGEALEHRQEGDLVKVVLSEHCPDDRIAVLRLSVEDEGLAGATPEDGRTIGGREGRRG